MDLELTLEWFVLELFAEYNLDLDTDLVYLEALLEVLEMCGGG